MLWVFLFKSKAAYEMRISDWSSHVRSSDLPRRRRCPSSPDRRPTSAKRTDPMFKRPSNHYGRSPEPVTPYQRVDRKSVVQVTRVLVRVDLGGRRIINKKTIYTILTSRQSHAVSLVHSGAEHKRSTGQ